MPFSKYKKINIFFTIVCAISIFDLAIFFYLPLLSEIRQEFRVSESLVQLSASINLLGIGISSMVYGILSDAWGRRKLVLFGIFTFSVASHCISHINSINALFIFRFIQGIGAGVAWSIGNAILHDIYKGKAFEKGIIILTTIIGIMMIISPTLGGYIGTIIGWRQGFNLMAISGLILFIYSIFSLPETSQNTRYRVDISKIAHNYKTLLTNYAYIRYLIIKVFMVAVAFTNIITLPLIFIEKYHTSTEYCGILMAFGSLVFVIGSFISNELVNYISTKNIIKYSLLLIFFSSITIIIIERFGSFTAISIQLIKIPYLLGIAGIFGNATHKIVGAVPTLPSSASAMMITLEMLTSSLAVKLVSSFYNQTLYPLEIFTLVVCTVSYIMLKGLYYEFHN